MAKVKDFRRLVGGILYINKGDPVDDLIRMDGSVTAAAFSATWPRGLGLRELEEGVTSAIFEKVVPG